MTLVLSQRRFLISQITQELGAELIIISAAPNQECKECLCFCDCASFMAYVIRIYGKDKCTVVIARYYCPYCIPLFYASAWSRLSWEHQIPL
jgi:hypothetical protein